MSWATQKKRIEQGLCSGCGICVPEEGKRMCGECRLKRKSWYDTRTEETKNKKSVANARWKEENVERWQELRKDYRIRLRREVIEHYGSKCACCGIAQFEFLTLDHKNGDGAAHRRSIFNGRRNGSPDQVYAWVRRNGYPDDFQVLCFNCNCAKRTGKYCPHELERMKIANDHSCLRLQSA